MGPYVETTESAAPALLVLSSEAILVRTTVCGVDTPCHGLTTLQREQPGEPVAGNLLGGFCEGGRAQATWSQDSSLPTTAFHKTYYSGQLRSMPRIGGSCSKLS